MTVNQVFQKLMDGFKQVIDNYDLSKTSIHITTRSLSPEEAIGITEKKDFPILLGKEIMVEASYLNGIGQAFTSAPAIFNGNLEKILEMDIEHDEHARGLFIAALNAVMSQVGLVKNTIHCKNSEPEECANHFVSYLQEKYGKPKIALIGYQPAILSHLSKEFELRVLDLNPENIGTNKYGVLVEHGYTAFHEVVHKWSDLVLCTGSTICNGSIVNFIDINKEVLFYGTTLAGAAPILGLQRVCFYSA